FDPGGAGLGPGGRGLGLNGSLARRAKALASGVVLESQFPADPLQVQAQRGARQPAIDRRDRLIPAVDEAMALERRLEVILGRVELEVFRDAQHVAIKGRFLPLVPAT